MPSRFEKCLQLLIESMTRSHTHGSVSFFFFTNLESFVVSCILVVPVQPPQSPTPCCNAVWCGSIVVDPRAFTQPLAEPSFERTCKSKQNLKYDQKTVSDSHLQHLDFSPQSVFRLSGHTIRSLETKGSIWIMSEQVNWLVTKILLKLVFLFHSSF